VPVCWLQRKHLEDSLHLGISVTAGHGPQNEQGQAQEAGQGCNITGAAAGRLAAARPGIAMSIQSFVLVKMS
jgi:hypothetical protein